VQACGLQPARARRARNSTVVPQQQSHGGGMRRHGSHAKHGMHGDGRRSDAPENGKLCSQDSVLQQVETATLAGEKGGA
jgi:hypothetical protein